MQTNALASLALPCPASQGNEEKCTLEELTVEMRRNHAIIQKLHLDLAAQRAAAQKEEEAAMAQRKALEASKKEIAKLKASLAETQQVAALQHVKPHTQPQVVNYHSDAFLNNFLSDLKNGTLQLRKS